MIPTILKSFTQGESEAIPVADAPAVVAAREAEGLAMAELVTLQRRERELQEIVDPPPRRSHETRRVVFPEEFAAAAAELPGVRAERQRAEAKHGRLEREFMAELARARQALDAARSPLRKPLVAEVLARLKDAEAAARRLAEFDEQTLGMGGSYVAPPCPELLVGYHADQSEMAKRDGKL